jgi:hypothetical protein
MIKKSFLGLFTIILVVVFVTPSITNAQNGIVSRFYVSPNIEGVHYNLTVYSPNNQTSYSKTIPIDINLQWVIDRKPTYPFTGFVSYHIDDEAEIDIKSSQTANDQYASYQQDFKINPSFSYLANISGLENGYHNLVITGNLYLGSSLIFNEVSTPFQFLVDNSTPTPSPTSTATPYLPPNRNAPHIDPTFYLLPISIIIAIFAIATIIYRRRKIGEKPK